MTIRRLASKVVSKLFVHFNPKIDREFTSVYAALAKVDMGNFSWSYDQANKRLVLQVWDANTSGAKAILEITEDGVLRTTGAPTYSTTVESY